MDDQTECFPAVVLPSDLTEGTSANLEGLVAKIERDKPWLEQKLSQSGAVLLSGFPITDPADFARLVEGFGYRVLHDIHGSHTRRHVEGPVYTANEETPLETGIGFHNELTFIPEYPEILMFYCHVPPPKDGSGAGGTGIVRGDVVYERVSQKFPGFLRDLESKGVNYFHIVEKSETSRLEFLKNVVPLEDGRFKMFIGPHPGVTELRDGKKAWFNAIGAAGCECVEYGDGTAMPIDAVEMAMEMMNEKQSVVEWKQGDVLIIDNHRVLHSRHPSKAPRIILVSMLKWT